MRIRNVVHRGLRRFIDKDDASALPPVAAEKIRNMISFLQEMGSVSELRDVPAWKAHRLGGDRKGRWSLIVTRNWRITFGVDEVEGEIIDLDYEDYH